MASGPRSMDSAASCPPAYLTEIAECFGDAVHLACTWRASSRTVAVAAGFSPHEALGKAEARAAAVAGLEMTEGRLSPAEARELALADFVPKGRQVAGTGLHVTGIGLISRQPYRVPAEVVWLREADGTLVEPTLVGLVGDPRSGVAGSVADVIAHDVIARWWTAPHPPLTRVSGRLPELLPPGLATSLTALGLLVSAFVVPGVPGLDFEIAIVGISGGGTTIATAAGPSVRAAVGEAFLRAVASRAQPWNTLPKADSLRRLTVWHRAADYLAHLERTAREARPGHVGRASAGGAGTWVDSAVRRFGHEPILIESTGAPVKVVCPGAACYHPDPSGATLPCPVP